MKIKTKKFLQFFCLSVVTHKKYEVTVVVFGNNKTCL